MKFLRSFLLFVAICALAFAQAPVRIGTKVTFIASADGNPAPTFEWFLNGVKIADGPQLVIDPVSNAHAGTYTVKATNEVGSSLSAPEILVVDDTAAPVIALQPTDARPIEGAKFMISVVATGTPAPTYQWRKNGENIPGATLAGLVFDSIRRADTGMYDVIVTNALGSVQSVLVVIDVLYAPSAPTIKKALGNLTVHRKGAATFVVEAAGADLKYQWRDNKGRVLNESGPTLKLSAVNPSYAGQWSVTVSNGSGSVTSTAFLTVL